MRISPHFDMTTDREYSSLDSLALEAARDIEDLYLKSYDGGVSQRRAAIQSVIRGCFDRVGIEVYVTRKK